MRIGDPPERRSAFATGSLLLLLAAALVLAPEVRAVEPDAWTQWLAASPLPFLRTHSPTEVLTGAGVALVLGATTNGFVRSVLRASGTEVETPSVRLRGGRLIGILERWLIVILASAGEPTAAALVVSAKSLIRFPELNAAREADDPARAETREIDYVTEYFLLGSMLSWFAAIVPVLVLT